MFEKLLLYSLGRHGISVSFVILSSENLLFPLPISVRSLCYKSVAIQMKMNTSEQASQRWLVRQNSLHSTFLQRLSSPKFVPLHRIPCPIVKRRLHDF